MKAQSSWPEINWPWKRFSWQFKTAFVAACVIGLITHIYIFTNLLLNHDSADELYKSFMTLAKAWVPGGRLLFPFAVRLSTNYQLPVVIGFLSILALAVTAGLTVRMLQMESKPCIVLTAGLLVTTPAVASTFSYLYLTDAYFIALMMSAAAAYIIKNYRYGWMPGIVLLIMSCSIYQAYLCYAMGLLLLDCILRLFTEEDVKTILRDGVKYIVTLAVSLLLYYAAWRILALVAGITLTSYQGMNSIGLGRVFDYIRAIPEAYGLFLQRTLFPEESSVFFRCVQIGLLALLAADMIYLVKTHWSRFSGLRLVLLAGGIILIPPALNFYGMITVDGSVHMLMMYAFVLIFVLALKLTEVSARQLAEGGSPRWQPRLIAGSVLAGLMIWNFFCISNIAYLRMQTAYENSSALANRVAARIESLDGYTPDTPVVFFGSYDENPWIRDEFEAYNELIGTDNAIIWIQGGGARAFFDSYTGLRVAAPSDEQFVMVRDSGVLERMPAYPAEGSVAEYFGVIVVKITEEGILQ